MSDAGWSIFWPSQNQKKTSGGRLYYRDNSSASSSKYQHNRNLFHYINLTYRVIHPLIRLVLNYKRAYYKGPLKLIPWSVIWPFSAFVIVIWLNFFPWFVIRPIFCDRDSTFSGFSDRDLSNFWSVKRDLNHFPWGCLCHFWCRESWFGINSVIVKNKIANNSNYASFNFPVYYPLGIFRAFTQKCVPTLEPSQQPCLTPGVSLLNCSRPGELEENSFNFNLLSSTEFVTILIWSIMQYDLTNVFQS